MKLALTLSLLCAASALACGRPATTSTTLTAADVPASNDAPEALVRDTPAPAPVETPTPAEPASQTPVCRMKSPSGSITELFLTWDGEEAKGSLRTVTRSGMTYEQPLRAQRHEGLVIADDPRIEVDLAAHAAIVREVNGKKWMRVGELVAACE